METFPLFILHPMKRNINPILYGVFILGGILSFAIQHRAQQIAKNNYNGFDACDALFGKSCDGTIMSAFSVELGVSLAAVGLVYFGLIGLLLILDKKLLTKLALFISAFATGSAILLAALLLRTGLSCSICLVIHLLIALSFVFIWLKIRFDRLADADSGKMSISKQIIQISGVTLFFVLGLAGQFFLVGNSEGMEHLKSFDSLSKEYKNAPVIAFDWNNQDRIMGSNQAPVKIVMISSFQCPGCKTMSKTLKRLKGLYGDDIAVNYLNYPLSSQCNALQTYDMQPGSCPAALAAIAAGYQGKFWAYHDKIFDSGLSLSDEDLKQYAAELELDMAKWETDRISERAQNDLQADIALGNELQINATPTIYVDGKKAPRIDESFLRYIIHGILNH